MPITGEQGEARPGQPPQVLSRWGVPRLRGPEVLGGCCAKLASARGGTRQVGRVPRRTPPVPGSARLGQTVRSSFQTRTKGHTVLSLHCIVNNTS